MPRAEQILEADNVYLLGFREPERTIQEASWSIKMSSGIYTLLQAGVQLSKRTASHYKKRKDKEEIWAPPFSPYISAPDARKLTIPIKQKLFRQ